MKKNIPDNIVYAENEGYNASFLPYSTSVGAPIIKVDDVAAWKGRGVRNVNKEFENKFQELKLEYDKLMEEFQWNEIIYNAKFSFEPVIGEIYHLYSHEKGHNFLSLIPPHEWNKEHLGTFHLNSDKKWVKID